jgi:hypothetical protein
VIKPIFRPVARNGIQQWLPDTQYAGANRFYLSNKF